MQDKDFEDWYNSYTYGSKLACIRCIQSSDLSLEEKKVRILSHIANLPKESQEEAKKVYGVL